MIFTNLFFFNLGGIDHRIPVSAREMYPVLTLSLPPIPHGTSQKINGHFFEVMNEHCVHFPSTYQEVSEVYIKLKRLLSY